MSRTAIVLALCTCLPAPTLAADPMEVAETIAEYIFGADDCGIELSKPAIEHWIDARAPGRNDALADAIGGAIMALVFDPPQRSPDDRAAWCADLRTRLDTEGLRATQP